MSDISHYPEPDPEDEDEGEDTAEHETVWVDLA
jgi:hypothetical protein